jgi:hypothetical protein
MSESPDLPPQTGSDDSPPASTGDDVGRTARVRTEGETAVDDAMGTGDNVH